MIRSFGPALMEHASPLFEESPTGAASIMSQNNPSTPVGDGSVTGTAQSQPVSPPKETTTSKTRKDKKKRPQPLQSSTHIMRLRDRSAKVTAGKPSTSQSPAADALPQLGSESVNIANSGPPMITVNMVNRLEDPPCAAKAVGNCDTVPFLPLPGVEPELVNNPSRFFPTVVQNDFIGPSTSTSLPVQPESPGRSTNVLRITIPGRHPLGGSSITRVIVDPLNTLDTANANDTNHRADLTDLVLQSQTTSRVQSPTLSNRTLEVPRSSSGSVSDVPGGMPSNGASNTVPQEALSHGASNVPQETPSNGVLGVPQETLAPSLHGTQGVVLNAAAVSLPQDGSRNPASSTAIASLGVPPGTWNFDYRVTPPSPDAPTIPFKSPLDASNFLCNVTPGMSGPRDTSTAPGNDSPRLSAGPSHVGTAMEGTGLSHPPINQDLDDGWSSLKLDRYSPLGDMDIDNMDVDDTDVDDTDVDDTDVDDMEGSDGPATIGRISDANTAIIKAGYLEVQKVAMSIAATTGLSVSQVFKQWSLSDRRQHVKLNHWNLYSKYFKDNQKQELERLPYSVTGEISQGVRKDCYDAFKRSAGPKSQVILEAYHKLLITKEGMRQKSKDRNALFRKSVAKLTQLMNNFEMLHGFSGVFAVLGSVPNSDSGLAKVYETKDASGFFEARCRADEDEVLTHLKAHVYNNVSLELVNKNFARIFPNRPGLAKTDHRAVKTSRPQGGTFAASTAAGPSDDKQATDGSQTLLSFCDMPTKHQDLSAWVIRALLNLLNQLQIPGMTSWKSFPWRTMGTSFPKYNIQGHNWPEGVPFPPVDQAATIRLRPSTSKKNTKAKSSKAKTKGKGKAVAKAVNAKASAKKTARVKCEDQSDDDYDICVWDDEENSDDSDDDEDDDKDHSRVMRQPRSVGNLPLNDLYLLGRALCDEDHPLYFVIYDEGRPDDIAKSIKPLLFGEPPVYTSKDTRGRRLFANGRTDRLGLPRLKAPLDNGYAKSNRKISVTAKDGIDNLPPRRSSNSTQPLQESDNPCPSSSHNFSGLKGGQENWEMFTLTVPTTPRRTATPPSVRDCVDISDTESAIQPSFRQLASPGAEPQIDFNRSGEPSNLLTLSKSSKGKERASDVGQGKIKSAGRNDDSRNVKRRLPSIPEESRPNKHSRTASGQPTSHGVGLSKTVPGNPPNASLYVQQGVPSNIPSYVEHGNPPGIPSHVQQTTPASVQPHIQQGNPLNIPSHIQHGNPSGIPSHVQQGVPSNVPSHVQHGSPATGSVPAHVQFGIPQNVPSHVQQGNPASFPSHVPQDNPLNVASHIQHGNPSGIPSHVQQGNPASVPSHVQQDNQLNVPLHVQHGNPATGSVPAHIQQGVPSNVPSHVQQGNPASFPLHVPQDNPLNVASHIQQGNPASVPSHVQQDNQLNVPSHVQQGVPSNVPSHVQHGSLATGSVPAHAQFGGPPNAQMGFPRNVTSEFPHGQMNVPQVPATAPSDQWNFAPPWMAFTHNGSYFGVGQNGFPNNRYQPQNAVYGPGAYPAQSVQGNPWNPGTQQFLPAGAIAQQSPAAAPAQLPHP